MLKTKKETKTQIEIIVFTQIEIIVFTRREGGDIYNGDADAEEPEEGSKKRKKKVLDVN